MRFTLLTDEIADLIESDAVIGKVYQRFSDDMLNYIALEPIE
jgi:hypothetical protein